MGDVEQQLRQMADHRAAQVQPYEPPRAVVVALPVWRRSRALAAMAACFVVLAVAGGWAGWSALEDDGRATGVTPTTGAAPTTGVAPTTANLATTSAPPTTTAPVACTRTGSTARQQGAGTLSTPPRPSVLANVQVQASHCVDEVSFAFLFGTPDWTVEYQPGPFSNNPKGDAVRVAGRAFLVVRMTHAAGADLTAANPQRVYTGPLAIRPDGPSGVAEAVQTEDFEAQIVWVLGLDSQRDFSVETRGGRLVVVIQAVAARARSAMTCISSADHVGVTVPNGWFVELSDGFRCRQFGPGPFEVTRVGDDVVPPVLLVPRSTSWSGRRPDSSLRSIGGVATTIEGRRTMIYTGEYGVSLYPSGSQFVAYEIEWPDGILALSAVGLGGAVPDATRVGLDAIAASARYVP